MSLLTRFLDNAQRADLSKRATSNGVRLEDVIRSGQRHPDSAIGIYAHDVQSYEVFRELFDPILLHFRASSKRDRNDIFPLNSRAVVSTRIRVARNLAGHVFPAGMSRPERLSVESKITRACDALAPEFAGRTQKLQDIPSHSLDAMISSHLAFGPGDKYMAAAGVHADWPLGRSVFTTPGKQLSVWMNEEDHLRVAVVMPGACVPACSQAMALVMASLEAHLDFCRDPQHGYLTSCPSNVGSAMRVSCMMDMRLDPSQALLLERMESAGIIEIRGGTGEHSSRSDGLVDVGFRHRGGVSEIQMQQDMDRLFSGGGEISAQI